MISAKLESGLLVVTDDPVGAAGLDARELLAPKQNAFYIGRAAGQAVALEARRR